jgi:hypothetical protein
MISAFASPVLVPADGAEVLLERVPLSGADSKEAYSESWLQDLVYRHPASLPISDIDDSFAGMVPICREMPTPVGPVDVVFVTRDGRPVIVEAKLWRNPEARRKVIGQILDYAKELSRWDMETFDAAVRRARQREDKGASKGLLEILGLAKESPDAARFHDSLTRSLKRGDILLLIVGDGIREGVGAITEFLEGHGSLHFTFGLVEMAIFKMPSGGQLVQPRILAQSSIVKRMVVDLRSGTLTDDDESAREEAEDGPPDNDRAKVLHDFWSKFLGDLVLQNASQPIGGAANGGNQFFRMPQGSDAWVSAYVARYADQAGVYLTFGRGPIGDRLYAALERDRAAVERDLGVPAVWKSDGVKHFISTEQKFPGPLLDVSAVDVRRKLADWTNRYVNTFRPRIERLVREVT